MALIVKDRVKETTTTTGTGTVTLAGASTGFQSFAAIGNGNTTYYAITSGNDYEVGLGTYTSSGTTLSRTTVLESSNSGSAITLSGTSDVFCTYPAEKALYLNGSDVLESLSIGNTTTGDSLDITTTEDSSDAAPVICLKRNSSSPTDGDYLGQIKFKGENDADQEVVYAKITGKISDASDTTEDGLIEFTIKDGGSNTIAARLTNSALKLINSTALEVDGSVTATSFSGDGSALTSIPAANLTGDVPIASFPTGTILQVVTNTPDTGVVNTTNTAWANLDGDLYTAITPKASDSTLILEAVFVFGGNNNTGISYHKFYDITSAADVNLSTAGSRQSGHTCVRNQDYDANDCVMVTMMTTVSAASTTARTYSIYNRCENGTQASYFGNPSNTSALGYAKPTFKITEVSA